MNYIFIPLYGWVWSSMVVSALLQGCWLFVLFWSEGIVYHDAVKNKRC